MHALFRFERPFDNLIGEVARRIAHNAEAFRAFKIPDL